MREKAGVVRVREQHMVLLSGSYCAALLAVRAYIGQPLWAHSHTLGDPKPPDQGHGDSDKTSRDLLKLSIFVVNSEA